MTKKEIVKQISDDTGLTQLKTKEIVQKTFDAIVETLLEEGRIELRNFGVFEVKRRRRERHAIRARETVSMCRQIGGHVQAGQGDGGENPPSRCGRIGSARCFFPGADNDGELNGIPPKG